MIIIQQIRQYLNEGKILYCTVAVLSMANLAFYLLVLGPKKEESNNFKNEFSLLKKESVQLRRANEKKRVQLKHIEQFRSDAGLFIDKLPPQGKLTKLIQDIHKLARKERLIIKSASYSQAKGTGGDILSNSISFPLTGTYRQIRKFIYNIEKMDYPISIDDLSISKSWGKNVSLSIKLSCYFQAGIS
ncbi:MAG: type 4a pilus biogenesis protein PilO [Proteobacteria bacterium]|nr:type 4a pilus biogenesis protein PilO [Pseudomonadota bacterium]